MTKTNPKLRNWLLATCLAVSLAFNALWIAAADDLVELILISNFGRVHADALKAAGSEDWVRASHLYAYLANYHPQDCTTCPRTDVAVAWMLPVWAISSMWDLPKDEDSRQRLLRVDRAQFSAAYSDAMQKAGLLEQRTAARR